MLTRLLAQAGRVSWEVTAACGPVRRILERTLITCVRIQLSCKSEGEIRNDRADD